MNEESLERGGEILEQELRESQLISIMQRIKYHQSCSEDVKHRCNEAYRRHAEEGVKCDVIAP